MLAPLVAKDKVNHRNAVHAPGKSAAAATSKELEPQALTSSHHRLSSMARAQLARSPWDFGNGARLPPAALSPLQRAASALGKPIQAKLKIGDVHDPLEADADRVAKRVMRGQAVETTSHSPGVPQQLNQKCPACGAHKCEACEQESALHTRSISGTTQPGEAPSLVSDVLSSSGQPLDAATRSFMEPRFHRDLSAVRIHTDSRAAASADAVTARAYTVGHNIVFAAGEYQPSTHKGRTLLAHELAHHTQQAAASTLRREPNPDAKAGPVLYIILNRDTQVVNFVTKDRSLVYRLQTPFLSPAGLYTPKVNGSVLELSLRELPFTPQAEPLKYSPVAGQPDPANLLRNSPPIRLYIMDKSPRKKHPAPKLDTAPAPSASVSVRSGPEPEISPLPGASTPKRPVSGISGGARTLSPETLAAANWKSSPSRYEHAKAACIADGTAVSGLPLYLCAAARAAMGEAKEAAEEMLHP